MRSLVDMIWIEARKAIRSGMPLWTALGSLFMPLGIAFLIFVAKHPEFSQQLGLVSAKANLLAYSATDWPAYLGVYAEVIGAGGLILFTFVVSWIFGREFADGTVKDLLAVPVPRASILLAKFSVAAVWSAALTLTIFAAGLVMGALLQLPGGSLPVLLRGAAVVGITCGLVIVAILPLALMASVGRGYLLPIAVMILIMVLINLAQILGLGEYFPWAVPMLYTQAKTPLAPVSYAIVLVTGLLGLLATYLWWQTADQNR
jgi:ABC-2 type transport system permease protein